MQSLQPLVLPTAAQNKTPHHGQNQDWCRFTGTTAEVWQKSRKLSVPQAEGLSSVHTVQGPQCCVKDGWPVNKRAGENQWQQWLSWPPSSERAPLVHTGGQALGPRGKQRLVVDTHFSPWKNLEALSVNWGNKLSKQILKKKQGSPTWVTLG